MPDILPLSPLRRQLCSYDNAARVAGAMADAGLDVAIVSTLDPLQPWRIVEPVEQATEPRILECA
ncbi:MULTISPECIES: hypothetical protein [unclassified Sphingomonas]|uniref:hypothetical protein n=1 Tax=unclassified Sphingomonas TaxID=196159 RepID=UPI00226AF27A|nr:MULTISPECIES: hypothetical protein [unclassified Sphingomonas]